MTPDDIEAIRVIVHAEMHESEEEHPRKRIRLRLWHRCALVVFTFGAGVVLHVVIENEVFRAAAQSLELSLSALYAYLFDKVKEVGK